MKSSNYLSFLKMATVKIINLKKKTEEQKTKIKYISFDTTRYLCFGIKSGVMPEESLSLHPNRGVYWGNLKLFSFLLQFFNLYVRTNIDREKSSLLGKVTTYCCYVGASPGVSIALVAQLYPQVQFYLYDPYGGEENKIHEKFDATLHTLKNVHLFPREFTDEDAELWRGVRNNLHTPEKFDLEEGESSLVYFVSDIRSRSLLPKEGATSEDLLRREEMIDADHQLQKKWVKTINPHRACLKFRPPHSFITGKTEYTYLAGVVYRQCFEKGDSYETRLVVCEDNETTLIYKLPQYEQMLNHHNAIVRGETRFINVLSGKTNPIDPEIGLDNNYDSTLFTKIVGDYLESINMKTEENVLLLMRKIISSIQREYGGKVQKSIDVIKRKSRVSSSSRENSRDTSRESSAPRSSEEKKRRSLLRPSK